MRNFIWATLASSLVLSACGGGSDNITNIPPTVPPVQGANNQAPVLDISNENQAGVVGSAFEYDATLGGTVFSDPDGDVLSYRVDYSPAAQGLSDNAGIISGTPSIAGVITVTITASDESGDTAADSFDIEIFPEGTDQNALISKFAGRIDLDNLENYANQTVPDYILKLNDGGNPITDAGATLGRVLFYDPALSVDDTISCSSCHGQSTAFSDTDVVSTGVDGGLTGRHSMRLVNMQFTDANNFFWDNRATSLEDQESQPLVSHVEHGFSGEDGRPDLDDLLTKLEGIEYYEELFTYVFGDPAVTEERLQISLAQFTKSIWSFDSKYDAGRAQVDDEFALFPNFTDDENAGKLLYLDGPVDGGAGCQGCHLAPEFDISPLSLHNGVVAVAGQPGEFDFTNVRSPSLRDLVGPNGEINGPFMHDGSQTSLMEVVDHYDQIPVPTDAEAREEFLATIDPLLVQDGEIIPLNLSALQKDQLIAFLNTLSGSSIYTDTKYSDPF